MDKIKEISSGHLAAKERANILVSLGLALLTLCLASCLTREKINAVTWLNNSPLPAEICEKNPELAHYGFYRKLDDGKFEFMSFCKACTEGVKDCAKHYITVHETDFNEMLDQYLPKPNEQQ